MSKTFGDMMKEALAIRTQEEADVWFAKEVQDMKAAKPELDIEKCATIVRSNLGYMAGYYDDSAAQHVHKFFSANHPVFGGPGYHAKVTPKEAFETGKGVSK